MADPGGFDALLSRLSPEDVRSVMAAIAQKDRELAAKDRELAAKDRELAELAAQKDRELAELAAQKDREIAKRDELAAHKDEVIDTMQRKIQRIECARIASAFASRALVARPCRRECRLKCR